MWSCRWPCLRCSGEMQGQYSRAGLRPTGLGRTSPQHCSESARPASRRPRTAQGCLPSIHRPLLEHPVEGAKRGRGPRPVELHPEAAVSWSVQGLPVPHLPARTSTIPPSLVCPAVRRGVWGHRRVSA